MKNDDKEITDEELLSLFPADFFDDPKCDLTEEVVAEFEALDTLDSIDRFWSSDGSGAKSIVEMSAHNLAEMPVPRERPENFCQIASDRNFYTIQSQPIAGPANFPRDARRPLKMRCLCSKPQGRHAKLISSLLETPNSESSCGAFSGGII